MAGRIGVNPGLLVSVAVAAAYAFLFWRVLLRPGRAIRLSSLDRRARQPARAVAWLYWCTPPAAIAAWGLASYCGFAPERTVPAPDGVARSAWSLTVSGTLPIEAWISFQRVLLGFGLASLVGVPLGLAAGAFVGGRVLVAPINSLLRYVPPTAFVALLIVYFGVEEGFKYAVVFFGVIFFIVQMVMDVVEDVDARFLEIALTSGLSTWETFRRVIVPFSAPRILDVLRINLSAAWTFLVVAELVGAERGLGHFIAVSQRFLRLPDLYAGILAFGAIGLLTDVLLDRLSRSVFRWYYVSLGR